MDDFFEDSDAADEAFGESYDEGHDDAVEDMTEDIAPYDMSEKEAFGVFDLAFALGFGEEIGLAESEEIRRQVLENESLAIADDLIEDEPDSSSPTSLKSRRTQINSAYSSVTGRLKCPFEQWIKDICDGRKTIHDPVGGANSYGKSKY